MTGRSHPDGTVQRQRNSASVYHRADEGDHVDKARWRRNPVIVPGD